MLGDDVVIDNDIPGPGIYGNPNVPGKDQIGLSGPAFTLRQRLPAGDGSAEPGPGAGQVWVAGGRDRQKLPAGTATWARAR